MRLILRRYGGGGFPLMMAAIVATLIGVATMAVVTDYRRTVQEQQRRLDFNATLLTTWLERSLSIATAEIGTLLSDMTALPALTPETVSTRMGEQISDTLLSSQHIGFLVVADATGRVVWSFNDSASNLDISQREYFREVATRRQGYVLGDPVLANALGKRINPVAWPIIGADGAFRGAIVGSLGEDHFRTLIRSLNFLPEARVEVFTRGDHRVFELQGADRPLEGPVLTSVRTAASGALRVQLSIPRDAALSSFYRRTQRTLPLFVLVFAVALGSAVVAQRRAVAARRSLRSSEIDRAAAVRSSQELKTVFDNVADGIVVFHDREGFEKANPAALQLLGLDVGPAIGTLRSEIAEREFTGDDQMEFDMPAPGDDPAKARMLSVRVSRLDAIGGSSWFCVIQDVTAQTRLAAARQSFITSINHELRTPLTSLMGSLNLLENRFAPQLPQAAGKLVTMGVRNSERLLRLVNDILTVQAIDQGQLSIEPEQLRVVTVLQSVIEQNEGYGLSHDVTLVPVSPETDAMIDADPVRLQQVFSNLVSNAVKYSPTGGSVEVGARIEGSEALFWVRDDGPGIPEHARERIFDRFAKPAHEDGVQQKGTGLGLSITRELVERQGGHLTLTSRHVGQAGREGSGSTFTVSLPLRSTARRTARLCA
ncbi:ATP-binding protein [Mesobaculum littorinae]|uniref:ATP-binding protein n=1 Tax=Mesobaculum littorinae TaxID=2486419 RepID=UPI0013E3527E|nr:ATP-binding protein [Mesobaculum littorinae]